MDPFIAILNNVIKQHLGEINQKIEAGIKSAHLDPMARVTSGSKTLGRINLGIGHASVEAHYSLDNLRGLSSLKLEDLEITGGGSDPNDPCAFSGTVALHAVLGSNIKVDAGGELEAKLGFIHKSVGISGHVDVSDVTASANGSFAAAVKDGQICLNTINLSGLSINYGGANIHINGLGFFNDFLKPLENLILDAAKGAIRGLVADKLKPVLNDAISGELPLCGKVS